MSNREKALEFMQAIRNHYENGAPLLADFEGLDALEVHIAELERLARIGTGEVPLLDIPASGPVPGEIPVPAPRRAAALLVAAELEGARALHPGNRSLFTALGEEVGELADAILAGDFPHAREEAVQVACVAARIIEEDDGDWMSKPTGHRLSLLDAASSFGSACKTVLDGGLADV